VDGTAGLLPTDRDIADVLRRSSKKTLLVVNKLDNEQREALMGDFYALGLGTPVPASALAGRNVGDLLDILTADMPADDSEPVDPRLKIAVIGKPNVGKSSLINALLQESRHIVTEIPGTTRDPIDAVLRYHGEEMLLIDTAGLRRRSKIKESVEFYSAVRSLKSIERCDVAVILLDAMEGLEHQDLRIVETALERRRPVVIGVNKWDLVEKDDRTAKEYERALKEKLRKFDFLPVIFISALTKQRVFKVIELVKRVDAEQQKRIPTSQLNDLLGQDIKTFPPRSRSGKEIKINYITQVKSKPPVFAFFCNEPRMIDDTYKRYLENKIRSHFEFAGVPVTLSFKQKN